jgi:hypothetical protein
MLPSKSWAPEPNPASLDKFDELPPSVQAKLYRTLAVKPHLRGERLLDELESKLTLAEQVEAEAWLRSLRRCLTIAGTVLIWHPKEFTFIRRDDRQSDVFLHAHQMLEAGIGSIPPDFNEAAGVQIPNFAFKKEQIAN